jgi:catabolite regulation protein CreA
VARVSALFRAKVSGKDASSEEDAPARAPAFVALAAASVMSALTATLPPPAVAGGDSSLVSEFNASGIVFKDSVQVVSLEDPLVAGVNIYLSDFKRSVSAKLSSGDLFSEPSQTSLACTRDDSGVVVRGDLGGKEGKELFSERKNLNLFNNKTLKVRRVYDPANNALLYVSYSTRTSSADAEGPSAGQYKTSVCAVPLKQGEATVVAPAK